METKIGGCALWSAVSFVILSFLFSSPSVEGKTIRIDTHAHVVPPFYYDLLASKGLKAGGRPIPKWTVDENLALMDTLNIELAILSVSTPGAKLTRNGDLEEGRKLARQLNEYGHMLAESYPDRFQFFATLTLPDVEGSIAEAIYSLDTLKAAGVVLLANSHGDYLGTKKFDPLMDVLHARDTTVFIHPAALEVAPVSKSENEEDLPPYVMDFLLDTTRAATNLVFRNVTGRFPNIKFILAHSGGFLPFAAYRIAGALASLSGTTTAEDVITQLHSFYGDTALASSPSALPSTLAFMPRTHITYGTDYPYAPDSAIKTVTEQLDKYSLLDDERHKINFHNANNAFGNRLSHWRSTWQKDVATEGQEASQHEPAASSFSAL